MKDKLVYKLIFIIASFTIALIIFTSLLRRIDTLSRENGRLKSNQEILITGNDALKAECRRYQVSDSINAYKVSALRLRLEEYKKYRSEDMDLIRRLKIDKADMQKVIESQSNTIYRLNAELRDTVVTDSDDTVQAKGFTYRSKWVDVVGLIDFPGDSVSLDIHNREELMIVESVKYKRFLGFLWKTKKIKAKDIDVLSKNPNTEIVDVEYVSIEN